MNGIHDMGGMHGMGPIQHETNEPAFHESGKAACMRSPAPRAFEVNGTLMQAVMP
jgi:Nitrile hydratase beta subunit